VRGLAAVDHELAWSSVRGFARLALEGKFGAAGTEAGRCEIIAMLRQVLEYLWPAIDV
jgi:hypothetical protein